MAWGGVYVNPTTASVGWKLAGLGKIASGTREKA